MNRDLKDRIDTVEEESKSKAELEQKIQSLKEEINRQNSKLKEQKLLIENLRSQMKEEEIEKAELPSEINVLKDIVAAQRKELDRKEELINNLDDKLLELIDGSKNQVDINYQSIKSDEFIKAQKLIDQLTEENEQHKKEINSLQNQLEEIQKEMREMEDIIGEDAQIGLNEELINFKRLNFQLMEENGILRLEVESLKNKLHEKIQVTESNELDTAYNEIKKLTLRIEDLEAQINSLEELSEKTSEPVIVSTEDALKFTELREKYDDAKIEILKLQKENQILNQIVSKLKEHKLEITDAQNHELSQIQNLPKNVKNSLFFRMYDLIDDLSKGKVIDYLINNLKNPSYQIKKNSIKLLSVLKNKKIYDAFMDLVNDKDWLVRYNVLKALSKFENKPDELRKIFKRFTNDVDVDVRELAVQILDEYTE